MRLKKINIFAAFSCIMLIMSFTVFTVATVSKYVAEKDVPWSDDEDIDFTVDNVFEVANQDELFSALNNGYPFIRLSQNIENPLIITDEAQNLYQDLILDLNGIEIQRNGHDPILNITPGVRLTITDTSEEQTGGLYNPVGSVFNIVGGTITVARGKFESGPRYSEYYSYNTEILDNSEDSLTKRTLVTSANEVCYYAKSGDSFVKQTCVAPIIQSYPTEIKNLIYTHGNLYFDVPLLSVGGTDFTHPIDADTYCYYQTSEESAYAANTPDDADWYYVYYVTTASGDYYAKEVTAEEEESGLYTKITIYGYENVILDAASKTQKSSYYAAIKMQSGLGGKLDIQDGKFFSYFGVSTTAAVNAMGGTITIKSGEFSSRIPNAYSAVKDSVLLRENDHEAFDDSDYFNNFKWANDSFTDGAIARQGESYCILNSGNAKITVDNGKFYSSNNNTISMTGGTLTAGGTFTKNNTIELTDRNEKSPAVHMNNGTLTVTNAEFNVYGDYNACVYINAGTISISDSSCNIYGSHSYGIYSLVVGAGNFTVTDTDFNMAGKGGAEGTEQIGIYAENGEVLLNSVKNSTVSIQGTQSKAVYAANGSTVKSEGYSYSLSGDMSDGIYSTGGKTDVSGGTIRLQGASSAGIYSTGGEVNASGVLFVLNGASSAGIYSTGGSITTHNGCNMTLTSNDSCYGIYAASADSEEIISILIDGATVRVGDNSENAKTGTVLASAGVFLSSANRDSLITLRNSNIYSNEIGIAVDGGDLTCTGGGTVVAYNGSAVVVKGGNVRFENEAMLSNIFRVESTLNKNGTDPTQHAYNLQLHTITAGGAVLMDYGNNDGIFVSDGQFICNSALELTFTGLQNSTDYTYYTNEKTTSYAIDVTGGNFTATGETSKLKVVSKTGGGILINGGNIHIGREGSADNSISGDFVVLAQSLNYDGSYAKGDVNYHTLKSTATTVATWINWYNKYGGNAVEVESGNLTIYSGYYEAYYGNGLSVHSDGEVASNVTVYGGTFNGWMDGTYSDGSFSSTVPYINSKRLCGPASYCGMRVIGNVTVSIYGGSFDGGNGGASISGRLSPGSAECKVANVYLYAGKFGNYENPVSQDGICLYESSNVVFGAHGIGFFASADDYINALQVNSLGCAIAYSPMSYYSDASCSAVATASVYYGYYYAKNDDTGIANSSVFNVYNRHSSYSYFGSNTTKGTVSDINNALPLFYSWSGTSSSAVLEKNEDSFISYYVTDDVYLSFDYEVVGLGTLTITYTSAKDGREYTATVTEGVYTGANLYLKSGSTLTITYDSNEASVSSKGYFCKIYNYELLAPGGYTQTEAFSGMGFTDSTVSNTDSGSDVIFDGTTYGTYKEYTGDYLTYQLYNSDFWGTKNGNNWGQAKIYSTHVAGSAVPAAVKVIANADKLYFNSTLGIWNETGGGQVNDLSKLSIKVYRLNDGGTYDEETVSLSGSYASLGGVTLYKGDYLLIVYEGQSDCKIDLQGISYTAYSKETELTESFGTKS